jgi:methionyl-tRNA formyltransferase
MKIIFAGTPEFSVGILSALHHAGHELIGVYCQPDRPKGRGRVLSACPVKEKALALGLNVYQPESLKNIEAQTELQNLGGEVMIVVAYGQILPAEILGAPKYGCLNIHASLLPRWRGAAPIQRAIIKGDTQTGVSIIQMNAGLDTGDILLTKKCTITPTDNAQTLHDKLAILGAQAMLETLENLDNLTPIIQNEHEANYAKKLCKNEAWIDWSQSCEQIHQQIRAFNPYPIAQTNASSDKFKSKILRILSANIEKKSHNLNPGEIIKNTKGVCLVATGDGVLSLETVQLAGKKAVNIRDFTNAFKLTKLT